MTSHAAGHADDWQVSEVQGRIGQRQVVLRRRGVLALVVQTRAHAWVEVRVQAGESRTVGSAPRAVLAAAYATLIDWLTSRTATSPRVDVHLGQDVLVLQGADVVPALRVVFGDLAAARMA